ncbi:MAG TPA: pyrroloquinoline quinone biosynthesis protein PqqE [Polyangiaceae bacterium]|nr:pyrroloquinoline quinone biosynthesis protein PqqE [Polyangiaceae bacterium]
MTPEHPYTLVAELTYRCPLQCAYCSNPVELDRHRLELDTAVWVRIIEQAEALGVVQLNLSGGEPLLRDDLAEIIGAARRRELYVNLITSAVPLARERLAVLQKAGLDAVQISLQDSTPAGSAAVAGVDRFDAKIAAAEWTTALGLPLTINIVLHRENIERVGEFIALAERLGAQRVELANTQYLGWALANRAKLLPSRAQLERARDIADEARARLRGQMEVLFVLPDYYADRPRACMDGWGRRFIVVAPDGLVLPCHAAHTLPGFDFPRAPQHSLEHAWRDTEAFQRFRGDAWMPEPCRSCDKRHVDFGGCRCQAFHLTGEATATDPACGLSPQHGIVLRARHEADRVPPPSYRYRSLRVVR